MKLIVAWNSYNQPNESEFNTHKHIICMDYISRDELQLHLYSKLIDYLKLTGGKDFDFYNVNPVIVISGIKFYAPNFLKRINHGHNDKQKTKWVVNMPLVYTGEEWFEFKIAENAWNDTDTKAENVFKRINL